MEDENQIIFKICKTCCMSKELSKYRPYKKECKQCNNKNDLKNRPKRNKLYYQKNREELIIKSSNYYYKMKILNSEESKSVSICV